MTDPEFDPEDELRDDDGSTQTIGILGGRNTVEDRYQITRSSKAARLREIFDIARKYDVLHGLTPQTLRQLLEELGPTFVKAGQILSMRSEGTPLSQKL